MRKLLIIGLTTLLSCIITVSVFAYGNNEQTASAAGSMLGYNNGYVDGSRCASYNKSMDRVTNPYTGSARLIFKYSYENAYNTGYYKGKEDFLNGKIKGEHGGGKVPLRSKDI
ncbi:hypothetical protein [Labilibaculum euxinus]